MKVTEMAMGVLTPTSNCQY